MQRTLHIAVMASGESQRQQLEAAVRACPRAELAGRPAALAASSELHASGSLLRGWREQAVDVLLVELSPADCEAACETIAACRAHVPGVVVMAVGPMEHSRLIVAAMRAGASEYLEQPLRAGVLEEALQRAVTTAGAPQSPDNRPAPGRLFAVCGARGGSGATSVAVNMAVALQQQRRQSDSPVALLDAAPLGHAALHLNLKPQFNLSDLIQQGSRLDASLLGSLMSRHESGLELLAGAGEPLPAAGEEQYLGALALLRQTYSLVVVDLSARLDLLTRVCAEHADRVLLVGQTDVVSLWSAAKVRGYLDPGQRLRFEMVLNRFHASPELDVPALEAVTRVPVLWKIPNAHEQIVEAIERGAPPVLRGTGDLARAYSGLAAALLGRPAAKNRGWLPFLRTREVT